MVYPVARIVVVDDESQMCLMLRKALEHRGGDQTGDDLEAVKQLRIRP